MSTKAKLRLRVMRRVALAVSALGLLGAQATELEPVRPEALAPLYGQSEKDLVQPNETVLDVAYRHRLGFDSVARLNPKVKVWIPDPGTVLELPTEYILPTAPRKGLVINVPEMRLYDYTRGGAPDLYAIAIGDEMDPSLIGEFRVGAKRRNPAWTVPATIRKEKPELPAVVPPGEDNPLGDHWMTIGNTTYGIHGTNNPWSIGRMATHGCIRLYDDQLASLYERVPSGTPIRLVYQSVKLGTKDDGIYVEAHPDIYGREPGRAEQALMALQDMGLAPMVDIRRVREAVKAARGVPVRVGTLPAPAPTTFTTSRPAS